MSCVNEQLSKSIPHDERFQDVVSLIVGSYKLEIYLRWVITLPWRHFMPWRSYSEVTIFRIVDQPVLGRPNSGMN